MSEETRGGAVLDAGATVTDYEAFFLEALAGEVERAPKPFTALDFSCGRGFTAMSLLPRLPPGSRIVAVGQDRSALNAFHAAIPPAMRPSIFIRKESAPRLPFADGAFDLAWANLATQRFHEEPKQLLRQIVRALRPPGQLLVATPLRETVTELRSAITPLVSSESGTAIRALLQEDTTLESADGWTEALEKAGVADVGITRSTLRVRLQKPVASHAVFLEHVLPMWLAEDNPYRKQVVSQLEDRLEGTLDIPVHLGCVYGRRGRD